MYIINSHYSIIRLFPSFVLAGVASKYIITERGEGKKNKGLIILYYY